MTEIRAKAQDHLVPHFTRGEAWRRDDLLVIERGEGCYVWDTVQSTMKEQRDFFVAQGEIASALPSYDSFVDTSFLEAVN